MPKDAPIEEISKEPEAPPLQPRQMCMFYVIVKMDLVSGQIVKLYL